MTKPPTRRDIAKSCPKGALALLGVLREYANDRGYVRLDKETIESMAADLNAHRTMVERWLHDLELSAAIARYGSRTNRVAAIRIHPRNPRANLCAICRVSPVANSKGKRTKSEGVPQCAMCKQHHREDRQAIAKFVGAALWEGIPLTSAGLYRAAECAKLPLWSTKDDDNVNHTGAIQIAIRKRLVRPEDARRWAVRERRAKGNDEAWSGPDTFDD